MSASELAGIVEILDALPFQAFLIDSKNQVLACNQSLANEIGTGCTDAVGARCHELIHGIDEPIPGCPLEESVVTGRSVEEDLFDPWRGCWTRVSIYPTQVRTPEGRQVFLHLARDITKDKFRKEEEDRLDRELARLQKNEAVYRLATGIAHEFNNLLFILATNAEMAASRIRSGRAAIEETRQILEGIKRGVAFTRQLQLFGRHGAGEPEIVDVSKVLADMTQRLNGMLGEGVELNLRTGSDSWPIVVDRKQLEQAIVNLSANAVDAMPEGGTLAIGSTNVERGFRTSSAPGTYRFVLVEVSDTGTGMQPEIQERIFEPLFTTRESGLHAGLGLCMVERTVAHTGGYINVDSKPGRGTVFELYLRAANGNGKLP
jgi:two-component system cell cycle sensor histidine kinase/response regulator CckA